MPALGHLGQQPTHITASDADALNYLRPTVRPEKIELRLSATNDVDVSGLVIGCVDDEAKPMCPVNDNHV